jgi:hypothetical protein
MCKSGTKAQNHNERCSKRSQQRENARTSNKDNEGKKPKRRFREENINKVVLLKKPKKIKDSAVEKKANEPRIYSRN